MGRRTVAAVVASLAALISQPTAAQFMADEGAVRTLASVRSLKCTFPWYASAAWEGEEPKTKSASQEFGFHIDGVDRAKRVARLIGNAGADDLSVAFGMDTMSFIEQVPAGAVNVTTVYAWRLKSGAFKAVHSRHTAIGGPSPSQSYGYCESW